MKIINIVPGFGGAFYCGNCLRDSGFIQSLKDAGHDAHTLPIYLPLSDESCKSEDTLPVFYGAVNIYLKQNFRIFRNMPKWLEHFFESDFIMNYAAKKAGSTRASGLEEMTLSMLRGHEGYQKEELNHLIDFLKNHEKPDVIHLSNALLLGLVHKIKTELNIPVICSLQDEDVWLDAMRPSYQEKLWQMLREKGKEVDAFVAVSNFYANVMKKRMEIPDDKIHAVHIGVDPQKYEVSELKIEQPTIGYLSRMNEENGFEIVIDGFIKLKKNISFKNAKLRLSGGKTSDDKKFINKQVRKLKRNGIFDDVEFVKNFDIESLKYFFKNLTLLSVPVLKGEAFGLYQLEALASGVPLVQPALGAFPEIAEITNAGVTYEPNTAEALAEKWEEVLSNQGRLIQMSKNGRNAIVNNLNGQTLSNKMVEIYKSVIVKEPVEL